MSSLRAAGVIPITASGRVLLLQRPDGTWGLPGGKLERSDPSVLDGAVREFREETGYVDPVLVRGLFFHVPRTPFAAITAVFDAPWVPRISNEHLDAAWFDLDRLPVPLHRDTGTYIGAARQEVFGGCALGGFSYPDHGFV
jgi:8-oxo-dGTP pyrophosphatase MutT (NUDIX family)